MQELEFESLESIFGADFKREYIKSVWNVSAPKSCSVIAKPTKSEISEFVRVTLLISLSPRYPYTEPSISLKDEECISKDDCTLLLHELESITKERVGMEVIFDLQQHACEFLDSHFILAEIIAKGYQGKSLLDELSTRELIEKQEILRRTENEKRQRQQSFDISIQKDLESKSTLAKTRNFNPIQYKLDVDGKDTISYFYASKVITSMSSTPTPLNEVSFYPWKDWLFQAKDSVNSYVLLKLDLLIPAIITDNTFDVPDAVNDACLLLNQLISIRKEPLPLVDFQFILYPQDASNLKCTIKVLLLKSINHTYSSCIDVLHVIPNWPFDALKPMFYTIVDQFKFIHNNGFYYKNQDLSYILLQDNLPVLVYPWYLHQLIQLNHVFIDSFHLLNTCPPELSGNPLAQPTTVSDTWSFSIIISHFLLGINTFKLKKLKLKIQNLPIPNLFIDLLVKCQSNDPRDRPTFNDLQSLNWPIITNHSTATTAATNYLEDQQWSPSLPTTTNNSSKSRYVKDFEELGKIGQGGFGVVVKAQNKLDGRIYAVKKIKLYKNHASYKQITREIRSLSQIDSNRCVRYYYSWLEQYSNTSMNNSTDSTNTPFTSPRIVQSGFNDVEIEFEYSSSKTPQIDPQIELEHSMDSSISSTSSKSTTEEQEMLYIQMEYCDNQSLRDAIDRGITHEQGWKYLQQIAEALQHIHFLGILHRDLNPKNVFIDKFDNIKLGDFGLSIFLSAQVEYSNKTESIDSKSRSFDNKSKSFTQGVGTRLYVAPEVLLLNKKTKYTAKVDMYSLGIILLELFHPFKTGMERVLCLENVRSPTIILPDDFNMQLSAQYNLIKSLLTHDVSMRPSSSDLLSSGLFPNSEQAINVKKATEIVLNGGQTGIRQVMNDLLKRKVKDYKDVTYDSDANLFEIMAQLPLINRIQTLLQHLFESRGALLFNPPILLPYTDVVANAMNKIDSAFLIDPLGISVVLPFDHSIALSRLAAKVPIRHNKLYIINDIYRNSAALNQPRQIPQALYALVGHTGDAGFNKMAILECISLIKQLMDKLNENKEIPIVWYICVNNALILQPLLNMIVGNDMDKYVALMGVLHLLPSHRFNLKDLQIPAHFDINLLDKYNVNAALDELDLPFSINSDLLGLYKLFVQIIGNEHVVWNPLLAPTNNKVSGAYFQLCIEQQDKIHVGCVGEQRDIVPLNVENKELLQILYTIRFSVPLLMKYSLDLSENTIFMIASYDLNMLHEKYLIANLLRSNDLDCDVWIKNVDDYEALISNPNRYLLILKNNKIIKLRDLVTKSEREIQEAYLVTELKTMLNKSQRKMNFINSVHFDRKKIKKPIQPIHDKLREYCELMQRLPIFVVEISYNQLQQALMPFDFGFDEILQKTLKSIQAQVKLHGQILIYTVDNHHMIYPLQ